MNTLPRTPFGEGNGPSESEAELAGRSFHRMMGDMFAGAPETHEYMVNSDMAGRVLDLRVPIEGTTGIKVRLQHKTSLSTGTYTETAGFYEAGENDDGWGPKICDYVADSDDPRARRNDFDGESRRMAAAMPVDNDNVPNKLLDALNGLNLEESIGLNGQAIGVEEVDSLRRLLTTGSPLPYDNL